MLFIFAYSYRSISMLDVMPRQSKFCNEIVQSTAWVLSSLLHEAHVWKCTSSLPFFLLKVATGCITGLQQLNKCRNTEKLCIVIHGLWVSFHNKKHEGKTRHLGVAKNKTSPNPFKNIPTYMLSWHCSTSRNKWHLAGIWTVVTSCHKVGSQGRVHWVPLLIIHTTQDLF